MQEQELTPRMRELQQKLTALGQTPTLWYTGIQNGYNCFKTQSYDDYVLQYRLYIEERMDRLEETLRKYDNLNILLKLFYWMFNRKYEHFKSMLYYQKYSSAKTPQELKIIARNYNPDKLSYFSSIKTHLIALREGALFLDNGDAGDSMPDSPVPEMVEMAAKDQIIAMQIEFEELFKQQRDKDSEEAEAAIKTYYRKNCLKYHPDKNLGALVANEAFIALTEDYEFYCRLIKLYLYISYENREQVQDLMSKLGISEENDRLRQEQARANEERRAEFMDQIRAQEERLRQEQARVCQQQEERLRQERESHKLKLEELEQRRIQDLQEAERKRQESEQKMKESEQKMKESEQKMKESEQKMKESEQKMRLELQEAERKRQESEQKMRAEFLELVRSLANGGHVATVAAPVITPTLVPLVNMAAVSPAGTSTGHTPPMLAPTSGDKQQTVFFAHK